MHRRFLLLLALIACAILPGLPSERASAQDLSFVYRFPQPGTRLATPGTSIALRQGAPLDSRSINDLQISVVGSASGAHSGATRLSADGRTLLFYPDQPFAPGETVAVEVGGGARTAGGATVAGTSFSFSVLRPHAKPPTLPSYDNLETVKGEQQAAPAAADADVPRYKTLPESVKMPTISVVTSTEDVDEGYIFLANMTMFQGMQYNPFLWILDNNAEPIYIQRGQNPNFYTDFKRQTVGGVDYFSHHIGTGAGPWTEGCFDVRDTSYTLVKTWCAGNGMMADEHDFIMLENGNVLFVIYHIVPWDLRPYGGPGWGSVAEAVVQEMDANNNVVFQWNSLDHIPLADSYASLSDNIADYIHINSVHPDTDGNLLVSNRHTQDVIKINRTTGTVMWRLGGKQNDFTYANGSTRFSYQHDARRLPNGNLSVYDNGNLNTPNHSRAIEYIINEQTMVVTQTWTGLHPQPFNAPYMGNAQRLPNGNTFIGWGGRSLVTELKPDGTRALEFALGGEYSYRAFRFPWTGRPAAKPALVLVPTAGITDELDLYMSWNGATDVLSYTIYAGPDSETPLTELTTIARDGFETSTMLAGLTEDQCVFQIEPIFANGTPGTRSVLRYRSTTAACQSIIPHHIFVPFMRR